MKKKVFSLMMTLLLAVSLPGVMFAQNRVSNGTHGTSLKAIASSISAINRSTPAPSRGNATVVLNVPGDIWEDGTGYQLLLDADHNTYGSVIPEMGNFTAGTFADFEYTIPENAVCDTYTNTIVVDGSESITIPAGVYDYVFLNPYPGGAYYIASDSGFPGRGDNYEFESGKIYTFTLSVNYNDYITLTVTDSGDEPGDDPTPGPTPGGESDLHTLATYGVGNNALELTDLLVIERPNGAWMEPYHFNLYNEGTANVEVVLIDFLHNNGYFRMDEETTNYPFTVLNNGRPGVDLYINTNMEWTSTDLMESLLAVNTTERSTHLYNILAAPYTPYCPDVVEKAYNIGTITTGTTWHMYASEMWNEVNPEVEYNLHDNYTLPFPEIPEGYDAVMKFTADHDIMLNAYVSDGENGKVALYREDFAGRPGPMADNNYTMRPFNADGGGAPVAPTTIDFETGNFSQFSNYTNDATYPWYISADAAYTGSYGMMSGNAGVNNSASIFTATVNYTTDGTVSFDFFASGESGLTSIWDKCVFQIDGEEMFRYGEENVWDHFSAEVASGVHTFTWIYEKDYSLSAGEDCFKVDNIVFEGGRMVGNRDLATSFEGSFGDWTKIDADGDGFNWELGSYEYMGYMIPSNSGDDCAASASYDSYNMVGLYPDNYLVSPQIELGGSITFYACAQDPDYSAERFGVAVSTTNNTSASAFTTIQQWTVSAKSTGNGTGNYKTRSRNGRETTWIPYTVDLSAYSGQGYVAIRHFGCSDQFYLNVDDVTIVEGVAPTPVDPTPVDPETPTSFSAGPVIENLNVLKGTYYLVASSTDPDFEVTINYEELPCPIAAVTNIYPADNAWGISPENLILRWKLNDYANEWRLVFSSTYWPEDEIDTEHPATYVTEWSSNLQESFNISAALAANGYQLWNNTNYFWRIDQRSNPGTEWECYTQGPVFGFTTTLNVPQHLTATNTRIFEYEETVTLSWDPIVDRNNDRTYRRYRIYMDGERIYDTPDNVVTTSWDIPQDLLTYNMYNEHGYVFNVTAVYDEGESPMSNPVEIWVSGNGNVSGTAYEQDGVTPIGGVTVTIQGFNEFNAPETYTFVTDENGYYEGPIHAGTYPIAIAQKEGYQDAITVHPLPLHIVYQELTDHVDFIMDEVFYAPAHVCAEPVYVPGVEGDTLVQVWWDFNFFTELRENFEDWENTPFAWQNDATYPWTLTTNAHEGTYALKSGNAGVASSTSAISVTVNIPQDGMFSFEYNCQGEGSYTFWDHCDFVMDGNTIFSHGADLAGWQTFSTPITAGTHSFTWSYTKDSSVNPTGDCFTIDNIVFVGHPEDVENSRALHHYNIYRTDCYNDGPYNDENTTFLATVWRPDTSYFDVNWPDAPVGVYKYGVSAVYSGNQADNPNNPRVDYPFEDRESEIVWHTDCKPCIDKDMYLYDEVTVNVVMNSADSPEGTRVTFTNTNPGEQFNHPMEPIILPESGFYRFPSFRKGNYNILVEHAGFETILDYQEIWTATDLRYVMIEIIYNPINLYVSRTGWAMWEPFIPDGPGAPDTPDTPGEYSSFAMGFEGVSGQELPADWTTIDADGDGNDWYTLNWAEVGWDENIAHGGDTWATSASYASYALNPDNYLVSPQVTLGGTLSFWACAQDASWAAEHFGVAISTSGNTNASDFTTVQEWTMSAKGLGAMTRDTRDGGNRAGTWYQYTVDLSDYAGQTGYVAIRHFNCTDMFRLNIDDVEMNAGRDRADRHLEGYKVLCTSIDGEPIFNHNTVHPFCQLGTVDPHSGAPLLVEGNYYICKVAAIYSTGMSDYISCTWQYEPCEHWAGTLNGVTAEGNTITWDYPNGDVPGPIDPPQPTDEATIVLNVPGDIWGDGTGYQLCLDADHNTYGSTIPTTGNFSAGTFADFEYTIPENAVCDTYTNTIVINGSQSITVPAGVYDYVFLNPYPGGTYYIASDNGNFPGRGDDYEFEGGKTYTFTLSVDNYDAITLTITENGRALGFACNKPAVDNGEYRRAENATSASVVAKTVSATTVNFDNRDGWIYYDNGTVSSNILGLANQSTGEIFPFSFGVMFPAGSYQGNTLTKAAYYDPAANTGNIEIYQGGTTAPTTLVYSQPYSTTGAEDFVEFTFTTPVTIDPAQSLWVVFHTDGGFVAALDTQAGNANGMWLYSDLLSEDWQTVYQATGGAYNGNWMIRAYVEEGTTPPTPPTPPTPGEGILGAMIFVDGEWEAFVPVPTNTYTYEGDGQEICVRIVYDGANELPDNNYYYAMSCEECIGGIEPQPVCEAGAPLFAEVNNEFDQVHLYWAEQPEPPTPDEYSSFAESFENGMPAGWTTIDADGDGYNWEIGSVLMAGYVIPSHSGADCITSQSYDGSAGPLYPDNYLVSPQLTLGGTISFWACAQDASYAAEHFGFAVSTSGTNASDFTTIQEWTMTAKSVGNAGNYLTRSRNNREGTWYQYTIDLSDYAGMTGYIAIRHFNCSDMFYLDVDDIEMNVRMGNRDGEIVAYNIYRSVDGVEYELIGTVDGNVTEYFDTPEAGTYYYQVTAVYADGCESAPAVSGIDPTVNYVVVGVTGIGENEANVNLFPNPTKGNVTIQAKGMNRITVVSVLGQVVFDTELDQDEYIMNMAQFNTGLYMVRVYTNEGVTVKRVTVMH